MLVKPNTDVTEGTIVNPDGSIASRPTLLLSAEDAKLLREYKKLLRKLNLREALYCNDCWDGTREDGCKAFVTDAQIGIFCRCKQRFHQGQSF
jgi:hypothetical protein